MERKKPTPSGKVEAESTTSNKIFYLERDNFSNPEVIIIIAKNIEEATKSLNNMLHEENLRPGDCGKLTELDLTTEALIKLNPPGDRHFIR